MLSYLPFFYLCNTSKYNLLVISFFKRNPSNIKISFLLQLLIYISLSSATHANLTDTLSKQHDIYSFEPKHAIIPAVLITYGFAGIKYEQLNLSQHINTSSRTTVDNKYTIDDFLQYAPTASVYCLNAAGVSGQHNFRDRTIILATSYVFMVSSVKGLKYLTGIERPDGTDKKSFPSGHAATVFLGAEFLWQEYRDVSIWYGLAGYAIATGTGAIRIYNQKHWLTDVMAGAGIGILSTKIAYRLFPYMNRILPDSKYNFNTNFSPIFIDEQIGIRLTLKFN